MFTYNYKYESKLLIRSKWLPVLSILLLLLFGFAALNGTEKVVQRTHDITKAKKVVEKKDQQMLSLLDSIAQGVTVKAPYWTLPTSPMVIGNRHPRIAALEALPMSFIATGQSDLYTHYVQPTITGDDFTLNYTEMTSPIQLLFGSFDLSFVIIYLLPLLIIAFSYNLLSEEKENGSLKLLASQPIKIQHWLFQKLSLRFLWIAMLVVGALVVIFLFTGFDIITYGKQFGALLLVILSYMLFWFALAFLVNLRGRSSARNAVTMLGLWVAFVLLIPSVLNQLGSSLYPTPPRTAMINEMRSKKAEVAKKQDEILDNYLRDHPEYALNDSTQQRGFYHRYMATQKLVQEEMQPIVDTYEVQLQKQQTLIGHFKWISPAITVQETLNKLAGTSSKDYEDYRKQVTAFAKTWRAYLIPFLYNNQKFTAGDYPNLPKFQLDRKPYSTVTTVFFLLLLSAGLLGIGFTASKRLEKKFLLTDD